MKTQREKKDVVNFPPTSAADQAVCLSTSVQHHRHADAQVTLGTVLRGNRSSHLGIHKQTNACWSWSWSWSLFSLVDKRFAQRVE